MESTIYTGYGLFRALLGQSLPATPWQWIYWGIGMLCSMYVLTGKHDTSSIYHVNRLALRYVPAALVSLLVASLAGGMIVHYTGYKDLVGILVVISAFIGAAILPRYYRRLRIENDVVDRTKYTILLAGFLSSFFLNTMSLNDLVYPYGVLVFMFAAFFVRTTGGVNWKEMFYKSADRYFKAHHHHDAFPSKIDCHAQNDLILAVLAETKGRWIDGIELVRRLRWKIQFFKHPNQPPFK